MTDEELLEMLAAGGTGQDKDGKQKDSAPKYEVSSKEFTSILNKTNN